MAKVLIQSVAERLNAPRREHLESAELLRKSAAQDIFGDHQIIDDPEDAEVILFAESHCDDSPSGPFFEQVLNDPIYRRWPEKCFIHSGMDHIIPRIRGIFPSIERARYLRSRTRSGCYLIKKNPHIPPQPPALSTQEVKLLASFIGCAKDKPMRLKLMNCKHPRVHLADRTAEFIGAIKNRDEASIQALKRDYIWKSITSRFILCPRGLGPSSIRLFEAMELGRAPVIISDAWVAPEGPEWASLSITIPESELDILGEILQHHEPRWEEMGKAARRAWEQWFAPQVLFHRTMEACLDITRCAVISERLARKLVLVQICRPENLRRFIRHGRKKSRHKNHGE